MAYTIGLFGFKKSEEFLLSLFRPRFLMAFSKVIFVLTLLAVGFERAMGLPIGVLAAFFTLNLLEVVTGVSAAVSEGQVFQSSKFGKATLKTFIYFSMLGCLNQFRCFPGEGGWWLFAWTYWFIFVSISVILIRSIFENLHRMGVKEAQIIYQALDNKYTRVFALLVSPPDKEKSERA